MRPGREIAPLVLLPAALLSGCSSEGYPVSDGNSGGNRPPAVEAEVERETTALIVDSRTKLKIGTRLTASCVSGGPFRLRVTVKSGPHKGEVTNVPRENLKATSDPYDAKQEGQDPFGPLPQCKKN